MIDVLQAKIYENIWRHQLKIRNPAKLLMISGVMLSGYLI